MKASEVIKRIKLLESPENLGGMARYGINVTNAYGVSVYTLRDIAKEIGRDHELALELWASGIHEARLLACLIDRADMVTEEQMKAGSETSTHGISATSVAATCLTGRRWLTERRRNGAKGGKNSSSGPGSS